MDRLGIQGERMRLKLTMMGRTEDMYSIIENSLVVSDLDENAVIPLCEVSSRPSMPIMEDEISKQDVHQWPHLRGYVELDSHVDLLIGSDIPEALQPRGP